MSESTQKRREWKEKISREMREYWLNVVYLSLFFGMFTMYRRILMAQQDITYANYGISVIQALVLAKIIMIGAMLHLGRGLEDKPLIYPTMFKAFAFTVWVAIFKIVERTVVALWHGRELAEGYAAFLDIDKFEWLSAGLVVFLAFIPFFGVKELGRVLGRGKIQAIFFFKRTPMEYSLSRETRVPSPPRYGA